MHINIPQRPADGECTEVKMILQIEETPDDLYWMKKPVVGECHDKLFLIILVSIKVMTCAMIWPMANLDEPD